MKVSTRAAWALGLGAIAVTAAAGQHLSHEVTFDTAKPYARGSMADVRNSADTVQWIGCFNLGTSGQCTAVNSAGVQHSCSTTDPAKLAMIGTIHEDSYLAFRWDPNGICVSIEVSSYSSYATK